MIDNALQSGVPIDTVAQGIAKFGNSFLGAYVNENPGMLPHRQFNSKSFGVTYNYHPAPRILPPGTIIPGGYSGPPPLDFHSLPNGNSYYSYSNNDFTGQ
jgi:hypothetical protein